MRLINLKIKMIDYLPQDVLEKIFSYLNFRDLIRASLINKHFKYFFDSVTDNPNHLKFKKLFIFVDNKGNLERNAEFNYADSIEVKSLDFIRLPSFRRLFKNLEFLAIYSQSKNSPIDIVFFYKDYFDCFKNLRYLEFSHPSLFTNQLKNRTLRQFKIELEQTFKGQMKNYSNYLTLSNGEASFFIEKFRLHIFQVSRGFKQYLKLSNVKYLHLKKCLNEINILKYMSSLKTLKSLKLSCIGINNDLNEIFKLQSECEIKFGSTFTVFLKDQLITKDILDLQILKTIQCNLNCMGIQLVLESSILEFVNYAKKFNVLYDYVILLNYKSHLISARDLAKFNNLKVLYISKPSLSNYETSLLITSFKNIRDLQIVSTKIDQSFYEQIADSFPRLELLSITNCQIENFHFLNKLHLKKIVINKFLTNH